jgi:hypothetical protein
MKRRTVRQPPRAVSAARRLGGKVFAHSPLPQFGKTHRHASCPSRHFPDFRFEPEHRFRRCAPLWFPIRRETEAQKLSLPWPCHRALLLVYLELRRDESRDARHHSLPRPSATNVHITVVRIPREPKTSPLQLPVELVEHDSRTNDRSPEVSSTAFRTQPPEFTTSALDGYGLRCPLPARPPPYASNPVLVHRLVRFLHASFRPASRRRPCASL